MKRNSIIIALVVVIISTLSGCQAIADIFKAGFWTAIIVVVVVVGIILWLVGKAKR